jgi:hypothetical protein
MQTLRIVNTKVVDVNNISVTFTDNLTPNLITSNVSIISDTPNTPSSGVLAISTVGATLSIACQPLTPLASYFLQFQSVSNHTFESINGQSRISEDGVSNRVLITAPLAPDDVVKNYIDSFLFGNIYSNDNDDAIVTQYIKSLATNLSRALYDIRQVKNENYLTVVVKDESKVRGQGPFDRLSEEGAYEMLRVGFKPTGATVNSTFQFDPFPTYPITLQRQSNRETLLPNSTDGVGLFNVNSLTLNFNSSPVTKVNSIVFTLNTVNPFYTYDISSLGYQIKDSRYDQEFGFSYLLLADNQVRLNESILSDPLFSLESIIRVEVLYESKSLGTIVDPNTVSVYSTQPAIREVLPPIINVFNLAHAPVTDASNNIPLLGGITFIDPNSNTGSAHPAFLYEIPFSLSSLPFIAGQYAVDYSTGTIYVYGNDLNNDGTGPSPPLASYNYRLTYKSEIDYVYDTDLSDLVALPNGSLVGFLGNIFFAYEQVLIPGVDYVCNPHTEALEERINNKIVALNAIKTQNSPITNVFKIFNETSGEIYNLNRWNGDKVYFTYNVPPRILSQTNERASFSTISNELLFAYTVLSNTTSLNVFKLFLNNNTIVSATEDTIASFINTSLVFTDGNIFVSEKWFNVQATESENINRLVNIGEYMVDYANGVVYCAVLDTQQISIGSVSYKTNTISPLFPHIISVNDIYYSISPLNPKNKMFGYTSFADGSIVPDTLDISDEAFLNQTTSAPYQILNSAIGVFNSSTFVPGVTNQVKFVRSVFEYSDLLNSTHPFNFASASTSSTFNINVAAVTKQSFESVQFDGSNYTVTINENIPFLSTNITYNFSVVRSSDLLPLWDSTGTIVPGNPVVLVLPGINAPAEGDQVSVTYTISINSLSRVIVDYNKGDFFVDYTYLADEIIISYEYGDNQIDFRQNTNLSMGTTYYASYRAGALRDALYKNFGTLVNVPVLSTFDVDFNRERYRDALIAALTSFIQGPTVNAIKNIAKTISHIDPEIIESAFLNWSLGSSILFPESISTSGSFQLLPAKFGNGALINDDQTISFPVNDNIRLEEGTFETWLSPQWNGLDNDAELTFTILKDGYAIIPSQVFIGSAEYHPVISQGSFTLNKNTSVAGTPNVNKDGVFIYYDTDVSGDFSRWYVRILDGYVTATSSSYRFTISSTGKFYDSKSMTLPKPSNMSIFTGTNSLTFSVTSGLSIDEGVTFLSDVEHYILDFGQDTTRSRLSIFKDPTGYINFRVYDKDKNSYSVSTDVSAWRVGDLHHVAASWKINTRNDRDELHLFIDGFEVPNIIRYGQRLTPFLHEKFRTINPEEIIGISDRDIVGSVDLHTLAGSPSVSSSLNFSSFQIFVGDTIFIDEVGFSPTGYTIVGINGQTLALDADMPITLTDGRFSINRTQFTVLTDIDLAPNTTVSVIHPFLVGADLVGAIDTNIVSSSLNFTTQGVLPGYSIAIDNTGLPVTYIVAAVDGNLLTINDNLPVNISATSFQIYSNVEEEIPGVRAIRPAYSLEKDDDFDNILTVSNDVFAKDLILIRTLGINHKNVKKRYYVWSDGYENVLMTRLQPPISLDETSITKVILSNVAIGPSNSTLLAGIFTSNNLVTTQPTNSTVGRTISVTLSGNNVDFSSPVAVTINGVSGMVTVSETIFFDDYGTDDFLNAYTSVNYINVVVKPNNTSRNALNIEAKEKFAMTHSELDGYAPIVRFSYPIGSGYTLYSDSTNTVRDDNFLFSALDVNNYLLIQSPAPVAGYYVINAVSVDRKSITITPTTGSTLPLPSFTNGIYQVLNVNSARSGLQNGFFTFEVSNLPGQPYLLNHGFYELNYSTYIAIKMEPLSGAAYLGSDFMGHNQLNGIINEVKVYSTMLTDVRVGETVPSNQKAITKDFNSLKALTVDPTTLMLVTFNSFPFTNIAKFYVNVDRDKQHFQSPAVINENFGNSIVILDKPLVMDNDGILDTRKEGTIEFWMSPLFDTGNDPVDRFYFDAFGAVLEEVVSVSNVSVKISAPASQILSVKLVAGDQSIDYFAGGKLEIDTQRAIQEEGLSISDNSVLVSNTILQVITVKIAGDLSSRDYFNGGSVGSDGKTIYLGRLLPGTDLPLIITYQTTANENNTFNTQVIRLNRKLPNQNTKVVVNYIPQGLHGDRISIFKDKAGFINFGISASGTDYIVRGPTYWTRNTWHRVKASYKINGGAGSDEMRLFLDGYEYTNVTFGADILFGEFPVIAGAAYVGGFVPDGYEFLESITFTDQINELYIGSQYTRTSPIFSLIDNLRISNVSRPIYAPFGEPIDVNYSTNLSTVFPVTRDLFTTFLIDFDKMFVLNTDFTTIKNRETGSFDFTVNVLDSLGIVSGSVKSQEALESLIRILKPANSKVFINYIR